MISLDIFIEQCEKDLILRRNISENTLLLIKDLSDKYKSLCQPIFDFVLMSSNDSNGSNKYIYSPHERILVCRLIPLVFELDTATPKWSSYMLTKSVKSATSINGIKLSEIGVAFLEIFSKFVVPLNKFTYNFCEDLAKEFTVNYRARLDELNPIALYPLNYIEPNPSLAFLKYVLTPLKNHQPKFILDVIINMISSVYIDSFLKQNNYLFKNLNFRRRFLKYLDARSDISTYDKELITSKIINYEWN